MNGPFSSVADLRVGSVVEVSGTTVKVELSGEVSELTRSYAGRVYPIGQIGSIVKVHFGRRLVFGFVTLLRMRSEDPVETPSPIPPDADQRVMEIELFAEGVWNSGDERLAFSRGVSTYPLPRQGVYLLTRDEAGVLYRAAEGQRPDGADPLVPFATYVGADAASCRANIDKMFGMHCAVLGSTGSGKSGAVAALLHSVLEHKPTGQECKPRVVIIDPHGEYGKAFSERAVVYRAYDPIGTEETGGTPINLPYWLMSAEEFRSLVIGKTEFEATSQHNIVYKALTHARMVAASLVDAAPTAYGWQVPADGNPLDEPRPASGVNNSALVEFDRDKPRPFSLDEFINHIEYVQAARLNKGNIERVTATDFSKNFKSILDKLSVLRLDPRIWFLMREWDPAGPSRAKPGKDHRPVCCRRRQSRSGHPNHRHFGASKRGGRSIGGNARPFVVPVQTLPDLQRKIAGPNPFGLRGSPPVCSKPGGGRVRRSSGGGETNRPRGKEIRTWAYAREPAAVGYQGYGHGPVRHVDCPATHQLRRSSACGEVPT